MTFEEYQRAARRTQNTDLTGHARKLHALHGLAGEVGEIHGLFQKVYQGHSMDYDALRHEIGDLLWFVAELCDVCRWEMGDVASENIEKLRRRYPCGFSAARSVNRTNEAEA